MGTEKGYNDITVNWQGNGVSIDASEIPAFVADQADIDRYQRDGVVLLKGTFSDWVDVLRGGMQPGDRMREDWFPVLWQKPN